MGSIRPASSTGGSREERGRTTVRLVRDLQVRTRLRQRFADHKGCTSHSISPTFLAELAPGLYYAIN